MSNKARTKISLVVGAKSGYAQGGDKGEARSNYWEEKKYY